MISHLPPQLFFEYKKNHFLRGCKRTDLQEMLKMIMKAGRG